MRDSRISLPPLVEGPARGALRLSLGAPRWAEAAPAHLRQHAGDVVARVEWWGDASGGDLVPLPPPPAAAATAACLSFPLRTGPKYLARYLKDMGALTVTIEPAPGSDSSAADAGGAGEAVAPQPLAAATVGLLALDVQAPIRGTYPLVLVADEEGAAASDSGAGRCGAASEAAAIVGSLEVSLELDFSSSSGAAALVSSFELNEHLAGSVAAAGVAAEDAEDAGSDDDGGHSASSASDGDTAPTAQLAGLCEQLLFALQSRYANLWGGQMSYSELHCICLLLLMSVLLSPIGCRTCLVLQGAGGISAAAAGIQRWRSRRAACNGGAAAAALGCGPLAAPAAPGCQPATAGLRGRHAPALC